MKTLLFTITAQQPLLLTSLQGDPNSGVSYDYIPGSVIRGAIIARFKQRYPDDNFDPADDQIRRLFFDGRTRYLNAYPFAPDLNPMRMLPIPRALFRRKEDKLADGTTIYNRNIDPSPDLEEGQSLKLLDTGYLSFDKYGNLRRQTVDMHINIHNQRDRPRGRGVEGNGALFRYEAIAPHQRFQAAILCEHDATVTTFSKLLANERLWLGGSRSAGYGEALIEELKVLDDWREVGRQPDSPIVNTEVRLFLLSDLITTDAYGHPIAELPLGEIAHLFGISEDSVLVDQERSFRASTIHGGFNRTWGLPLPQWPALAAGSVFLLRLTKTPEPAALAALEARGLGTRRSEGFGRVALNWLPSASTYYLAESDESDEPIGQTESDESDEIIDQQSIPELSGESRRIAMKMARQILEQRLEQELIAKIGDSPISGAVSNTQLSRLRIVARRAMSDPVETRMQRVLALLDQMPANAREQFETARVGGARSLRLRAWLDQLINQPHRPWSSKPVDIAGVSVMVDLDLATRYTLRLMMAVARQSVKEGR